MLLSWIPHIAAPYVMVGRIMLAYRSRERLTDGPHVDAVIRCIAASVRLLLLVVRAICSVHLSLASTQIPRTFIAGGSRLSCWLSCVLRVSWTRVLLICIVDARSVLSCLLLRVKCMSWYFSGLNFAPCLLAQFMHLSWASDSV